jgi:anti-sigma factor RsiW
VTGRSQITCRELIDFIVDYADGSLAPVAHEEFERHLARCPSCQAYLHSYVQTIDLVQMMGDEDCVEDVPPELVATILAERR